MTRENTEVVGYCNPPKDTRWKAGQSGNPKGRPKNTVYFSEMLRDQLDQVPDAIDGEPNTKTWLELIRDTLLRAAVKGNQPALIKELLDRIEGKVANKHQIDTENPVTLIFMPAQQLIDEKTEDGNN